MKTVLIAAMLAAAPAEQAQRPCLTQSQIEDVALFAMPPLLEAAATACAPALPADAYLLTGGKALAASLATESSTHWAGASAALATIASDEFPANLGEGTARGLLHDLALGALKDKEAQAQCVRMNRIADLMSPLPPRNLAGLVFTAVEFGMANEAASPPPPPAAAKSKSKSKRAQVQAPPPPPRKPLICPTEPS